MEAEATEAKATSDNYQDQDSVAFTIALHPEKAKLFEYLDWVEASTEETSFYAKGAPLYQMQLIKSYNLDEDNDLIAMRFGVHNILDWGLSDRKEELCTVAHAFKRAEDDSGMYIKNTAGGTTSA